MGGRLIGNGGISVREYRYLGSEGLLGEKANRLNMFPVNGGTVTAKEEIFSRKEKWKNGKESMLQLFILW